MTRSVGRAPVWGGIAGLAMWAGLLTGCHANKVQGSGRDRGGGDTTSTTKTIGEQQAQHPVPTPPTADQISPASPQAVLDGTSTTETTPEAPPKPAVPPPSSPPQ